MISFVLTIEWLEKIDFEKILPSTLDELKLILTM